MKTTLLKAPALSAVLGVMSTIANLTSILFTMFYVIGGMSTTTITQKPIALKFSPAESDHSLMAYMLVVNSKFSKVFVTRITGNDNATTGKP